MSNYVNQLGKAFKSIRDVRQLTTVGNQLDTIFVEIKYFYFNWLEDYFNWLKDSCWSLMFRFGLSNQLNLASNWLEMFSKYPLDIKLYKLLRNIWAFMLYSSWSSTPSNPRVKQGLEDFSPQALSNLSSLCYYSHLLGRGEEFVMREIRS